MKQIIYILCLVLICSSCNDDIIYESFQHIDEAEWSYADVKTFEIDLKENKDSGYELNLLFRHNNEYAWRNLNIRVHTTFPDGTKKTSIEEIPFADAKGKWYGSGKGDIILNEITLQEKAYIEKSGIHTFQIEQFMRYEPLEGIMDIGMSVSKREN